MQDSGKATLSGSELLLPLPHCPPRPSRKEVPALEGGQTIPVERIVEYKSGTGCTGRGEVDLYL